MSLWAPLSSKSTNPGFGVKCTSTESLVATLKDTPFDTELNIEKLESIAAYFREVRKKYATFEGQLKGSDSRIIVAQVPGGMLTNMESQLKQQNAQDKLDQVLTEIPKVREELGFIPLVTPTSQIVGTQAVINVLMGERYKTITKETAGVLKGEYGRTPAPVNIDLQARVLDGEQPLTCRPADQLPPELDALISDVKSQAQEKNLTLAEDLIDDVLTVALFPQVGWKFLENRDNPDAFEPIPSVSQSTHEKAEKTNMTQPQQPSTYTITVNNQSYVVEVNEGGDVTQVSSSPAPQSVPTAVPAPAANTEPMNAPLAGNIWKIHAKPGDTVEEGQVLLILEAMKMETEVRAARNGQIASIDVSEGDAVDVGAPLLQIA